MQNLIHLLGLKAAIDLVWSEAECTGAICWILVRGCIALTAENGEKGAIIVWGCCCRAAVGEGGADANLVANSVPVRAVGTRLRCKGYRRRRAVLLRFDQGRTENYLRFLGKFIRVAFAKELYAAALPVTTPKGKTVGPNRQPGVEKVM